MNRPLLRHSLVISLIALFTFQFLIACQDHPDVAGNPAALDEVVAWNETALSVMNRASTGPDAVSPITEARLLALMHVAIHDALNHIRRRFNPYALKTDQVSDASTAAAVATAAHDVLVALLPTQKEYLDGVLNTSLSRISDATAIRKAGSTLGSLAATTLLANRANDGIAQAQITYVPGTNPGDYQFTPPFDGPPFNGFSFLAGLGATQPWVLTSGAQFRPTVTPYALTSAEYTADFNEIKSLGAANSVTRTPEQTQIAPFWVEDSPITWNRVGRTIAAGQRLDVWQYARLFALLHMAIADAYTANFETKYHVNFWRPITAIRQAASDGNPDTVADPTWESLAPPTPPVPDFPSGHASAGGAAAEALKLFFGRDDLAFTLTTSSLPNVTRTYTSLTQAAEENAISRVYVGYHFRHATTIGLALGRTVGAYVFNQSLK